MPACPAGCKIRAAALASDEELLGLIAILHEEFPIYKVRITGGEPLLRPGLPGLIERIRQQMPTAELAMTTNAVLLKQHALAVRRAGVEFLNTSLDTLSAELCKELTRGGDVRTIVDGIRAARAAGFPQIRINTVLMRTYNGDSLPSLVRFAAELGCEIRFIELMPFGEGAAIYDREFLSARRGRPVAGGPVHESWPPAAEFDGAAVSVIGRRPRAGDRLHHQHIASLLRRLRSHAT